MSERFQTPRKVVLEWRDFRRDRDSILARQIECFYSKCPTAKATIAVGNVRTICDSHTDLLRFETDSGGGKTFSASPTSSATVSGLNISLGQALLKYVQYQGGSMKASKVSELYEIDNRFRSALKKGIRPFCAAIPQFVRLEGEKGNLTIVCADALQASDNAARTLQQFVENRSGRMEWTIEVSRMLYTEHPELEDCIGGNVRRFCQQNAALLRFQVVSGADVIISVQKSSASTKAADTVPMHWKEYLDFHPQLIGAPRHVLKAEFRAFKTRHGVTGCPFSRMMLQLRQQGFIAHGSWGDLVEPAMSANEAFKLEGLGFDDSADDRQVN